MAIQAASVLGTAAFGQTVPARAFVPYSEEPINYLSDTIHDPVAKLQERIDRKELSLDYDPKHGYLPSLLKLLEIPVSSQTLVFSKTSLQYKKISPETPRALYFNDNVYVGWVKGGDLLEIASFDPNQGAIFYQIDQKPTEQPVLLRATIDCTQCHVGRETRGVPGVLLKSVVTTRTGSPVPRSRPLVTGHESPLKDRFGGWYVTGTHGDQSHLGNVFAGGNPAAAPARPGANVVDLSGLFATKDYLTGHSDIVAQMVLAHQTQMHNLITLVNYKARIARHASKTRDQAGGKNTAPAAALSEVARRQYEEPAEELLRYLLFVDEAKLEGPISGTSGFADQFSALGPRDPKGRSLRDFDLKKRIFKYPCSYLIYTEAFDALPAPAKDYVQRRLLEVLTGKDKDPDFASLTADDRRAVLEILVATKPGLPDDWKRAVDSKRP